MISSTASSCARWPAEVNSAPIAGSACCSRSISASPCSAISLAGTGLAFRLPPLPLSASRSAVAGSRSRLHPVSPAHTAAVGMSDDAAYDTRCDSAPRMAKGVDPEATPSATGWHPRSTRTIPPAPPQLLPAPTLAMAV